jgi:hypothetical protein
VDPGNTDAMLANIMAWLATRYPHFRGLRVRIECDGGEIIHSLPAGVPPNTPAIGTASQLQSSSPPDTVEGVPPEVATAIFNRLADTCKRHTREEMAEALNNEFSESVVQKALWKLRTAGKLANSRDTYGLGFGLPEWT